MKPKTLITIALLAFVAVSLGYLIVSESTSSPAQPTGAATAEEATAPSSVPSTSEPSHKVLAYYFHNTKRCKTCLKIERLAKEALDEWCADAMSNGELEWQAVNMEEPPNEHFVEDYQLVASSLVLVDIRNGEQHDWINMEKVWDLVNDEPAFKDYVARQAVLYLESPQ